MAVRQGADDQVFGAFADIASNDFLRQGCLAHVDQHGIGGIGHIGNGVQQSAVQVEQYSGKTA